MAHVRKDWTATLLAGALCGAFAFSPRPALATTPPAESEITDDTKAVVAGDTAFALELYAKLRSAEGNLFISPQSISTALAMTYAGARGETAAEMAKVLHFTLPPERLHPAFASLQAALKPQDPNAGFRLEVANALWGQEGAKILPAFTALTRQHYGAGFRQADFAHAADQARQTINAWVAEHTANKIVDLLQPGDVSADVRLVLTNAVYLKADWAEPFEKDVTRDAPFHLSSAQTVTVPLMHNRATYAAIFGNDVDVLELPYRDRRFGLVILLPRQLDGLAALEQRLTAANLARWLAGLDAQDVRLSVPRFKAAARCDLAATLTSLGLRSAFNPAPPPARGAADFSGIDGQQGLYIGKVIHQTYIDVDESGTEAAAATAVVGMPSAAPPDDMPEPKVFKADHPFIYLIRDRQTGSILFLGRLVNPK